MFLCVKIQRDFGNEHPENRNFGDVLQVSSEGKSRGIFMGKVKF